MQDDNKSEKETEETPQVEYASLKQLNEDRLRHLNLRLDPSVKSGEPEPATEQINSPFAKFQASVPEGTPASPLASMQKKFSTSWVNMQHYLSERKQNRDWDQKFR